MTADHPAVKRWNDVKDTIFVLYAPNRSQLELIAKTAERIIAPAPKEMRIRWRNPMRRGSSARAVLRMIRRARVRR